MCGNTNSTDEQIDKITGPPHLVWEFRSLGRILPVFPQCRLVMIEAWRSRQPSIRGQAGGGLPPTQDISEFVISHEKGGERVLFRFYT